MTALTLTDFLRARLDEDEAVAREWVACKYSGVDAWGEGADHFFEGGAGSPARVLADVAAKRRIVEWHENWPVFVEQRPEMPSMRPFGDPDAMQDLHYSMARQFEWLTHREYVTRFGSEPPTAPILRFLALPYASHPDYRQEWKP